MADYRVQLKVAPSASKDATSPTLAVDVAAPDHRQAVATAEAFVARDHGAGTFLAFTVVALAGDAARDGYDTAEEAATKNVIHKAIKDHLEAVEASTASETADHLDGLAEAVLDALLTVGISIPDSIADPYSAAGDPRTPPQTLRLPDSE